MDVAICGFRNEWRGLLGVCATSFTGVDLNALEENMAIRRSTEKRGFHFLFSADRASHATVRLERRLLRIRSEGHTLSTVAISASLHIAGIFNSTNRDISSFRGDGMSSAMGNASPTSSSF
jgi:hypothetical protein